MHDRKMTDYMAADFSARVIWYRQFSPALFIPVVWSGSVF